MHLLSDVQCPHGCQTTHDLSGFRDKLRDNPVFVCEPGCGLKFEVVSHRQAIVVAVAKAD
jgi:hypothetical protein